MNLVVNRYAAVRCISCSKWSQERACFIATAFQLEKCPIKLDGFELNVTYQLLLYSYTANLLAKTYI